MAAKILIYIFYYTKNDIYTTLYYYIFEHGKLMLNPLYNLSYFLIGMYFGIINYSIQKGVGAGDNLKNDKSSQIMLKKSTKECVNEDSDSFSFGRIGSINLREDKELLESMPFLKSAGNITRWHRQSEYEIEVENVKDENKTNISNKSKKDNNISIRFKIILGFLFLFVIILSILNLIFIELFDSKIENKYKNNGTLNDKLYEKYLLEGFISDPKLNCIYSFDIELFVFFIHWGFFIIYMKAHSFIKFFTQEFWFFFTKCYFSFIIVCNPVILFIFYESETVVKLTIFNVYLYYFINLVFIAVITIFVYIIIELPLKKIFKYIVNNHLQCKLRKIQKDEDDDDDDEDDDIKIT
jgi:hypothetical protein